MKPKDSVTLERGHLSLFRYPTRGNGTYLGRGDKVVAIPNPDLQPLTFHMTYRCFCTGNIYLTLGEENILREITLVKSESFCKQINNFVQN